MKVHTSIVFTFSQLDQTFFKQYVRVSRGIKLDRLHMVMGWSE